MKMQTHYSAEDRLARIAARFEATLPHLATKADFVGVKWRWDIWG